MTREERGAGPMRPIVVLLPLARDDQDAAMRMLASAADGSIPVDHPVGQGYVMVTVGGDAAADTTATDVVPARALDRAQPDGMPFSPDPLTEAERRVLRYLPTNLSVPEIAAELFCSVNTVKTHIRHVYSKLGADGRSAAVKRARALGMLAAARGRPLPPAVTGLLRYRTDNYSNG